MVALVIAANLVEHYTEGLHMSKHSLNLDEELKKCRTMDDLMGKNGLLQRLVGPMVERILEASLKKN